MTDNPILSRTQINQYSFAKIMEPLEATGIKRKRTPDSSTSSHQSQSQSQITQAPRLGEPVGSGAVTQINYLVPSKNKQLLKLIEGDSETFADVLGMLDDYEGIFLSSRVSRSR